MGTQLTWLGHGTWIIKTGNDTILLDPFLDDSPTAPLKSVDVSPNFMIISHGHFDHVSDAVKIGTRCQPTVIAIYEICAWLEKQGLQNTHGMNIGGGFNFSFGRVKLTPAFHSSVLPDGTPGGSPAGILLTLNEGKVYFACDTALFSDMKLIGDEGIDLAILPIGDNFTMGPEDSVKAIEFIRPKKVIPAHYNTWPPIEQDAHAWATLVKEKSQAEPVILKPGDSIQL